MAIALSFPHSGLRHHRPILPTGLDQVLCLTTVALGNTGGEVDIIRGSHTVTGICGSNGNRRSWCLHLDTGSFDDSSSIREGDITC